MSHLSLLNKLMSYNHFPALTLIKTLQKPIKDLIPTAVLIYLDVCIECGYYIFLQYEISRTPGFISLSVFTIYQVA